MAIQRMDNVGIVVEGMDAAIAVFVELGMELEGRAEVEGVFAAWLPRQSAAASSPGGRPSSPRPRRNSPGTSRP